MSSIIPVLPLTGSLSGVGELYGYLSDDILSAHKYLGPYTVTPRKVAQTLETMDKLMVDNVEVEEIHYSEVSNPAGGLTVNIGFE
jgi:hypothetical protein